MDAVKKESKYAKKFAARVKIANRIGPHAFYQMQSIDPKKPQRRLPYARVILESAI